MIAGPRAALLAASLAYAGECGLAREGTFPPSHAAEASPSQRLPPVVLFSDDFESFPLAVDWTDGSVHGDWRVAFNGFGFVGVEVAGSRVLAENPTPSGRADETHASLVVSVAAFDDIDLRLRVRTIAQRRTPRPNVWERAWVLWRVVDNARFYYLALRTDGWELGKEDPAYPRGQRFLASGASPSFPIGQWAAVRIRHVRNTVTVWVDGVRLQRFTDHERPYDHGAIGLYNEDAYAHFDDVMVLQP